MKIFSLHFITSTNEIVSKKVRASDINKNKSKTIRRKEKKLKKLGKRKEENKDVNKENSYINNNLNNSTNTNKEIK